MIEMKRDLFLKTSPEKHQAIPYYKCKSGQQWSLLFI
jgi:hypothetical protein